MKLQDRIDRDIKPIKKKINVIFDLYLADVGKIIQAASADTIQTVMGFLGHIPEPITFQKLNTGTMAHLESTLKHRWELAARDIEEYWTSRRQSFDLMSRIIVNYSSIKASPPWVESTLNLKDGITTDGKYGPGTGRIPFYFQKMVTMMIQEINQAALNETSLSDILKIVRRRFDRGKGPRMLEAKRTMTPLEPEFEHMDIEDDDAELVQTIRGPVSVDEGIYTLEDVEDLKNDLQRAKRWEGRQYRPWFSEDLKANNRYLRDLEQLLMNDAVQSLHSGMLQIGSEDMGIEDMVWQTYPMNTTCEDCISRQGLTMTEIADTIQDDYGDAPPPLHPNCLSGDAVISAAGISAQYDRLFHGQVAIISIEGESDLTITMNHPVLTDRGWVPAGELKKSDKVARSLSDESIVKLLNPNDHHVKTPIEKVSSAIGVASRVLRVAVPGSAEDFHGDGSVDAKINIVLPEGRLPGDGKTQALKMIKKGSLCLRHRAQFRFDALRALAEVLISPRASTNSVVSGSTLSLPLFRSHFAGLNETRFRQTSDMESKPDKMSLDGFATASDDPREIKNRLAGHIAFVEIKDLRVGEFSGHVYNLETDSGYYLANSLIVHNCNCQLVPQIRKDWADEQLEKDGLTWDDETGNVYKADDLEKQYGVKDMTFDEYMEKIPKP